jgi:hypothetical protein
MMEEGKTRERAYRRAKTLVARRIKQYILFIDFKKAFDKVNREKLLKKMLKMGFSKALVIAIQNMLTSTSINLEGENIKTYNGLP